MTPLRLSICARATESIRLRDSVRHKESLTLRELDRLFVANDKGGLLKIYDGKLFQPVGELNFKDDADNIRYDDATKKVYVGFGSGGIDIVNATDGKQIGSIKLSAHPEAFELEKNGGRIFVNIPNSRHVAVINRDKGEVIARWQTGLAFGNFPMALDEANRRLFVGCRLPPKLIVLNTDSGNVVANIDISRDPDELFYDIKRHRIYTICGAGKIDILDQIDPNTYAVLTKIDTTDGARTGLFVPEHDALFVAIPHHGPQAAEIREYEIK